jgi:nicotinamidase/pyrazinamidase
LLIVKNTLTLFRLFPQPMNNQHAFLIIDAQYDFCHPQGALFVPGAVEDMQRLKSLILRNIEHIDYICVTLDTHPVIDISHPSFWTNPEGQFPSPFTQIKASDVEAGLWRARFEPAKALKYLQDLETQREFTHLIWPEHCLIGSKGASLDESVMEAIHQWTLRTGKEYKAVAKGTYPLTEHFGIFRAQVPADNHPETQLNRALIDELRAYDNIYLAGEAKSHCVATSLKQVLDFAPDLAGRMTIIEDCMSDVTGLGHLGEPIYEEARRRGLTFTTSERLVLK